MFIELIIVILLFLVSYSLAINRSRGLPPGPFPLPFVGNLLSFSNEIAKDLLKWSKQYGPVFTVWMPEPVVVIADTNILHDSIIRGGDTFGYRPQSSNKLKQLFDPYGVMWKEHRRFAFQKFKDAGFLSSEFRSVISNYALEVVSEWRNASNRNEIIDVTDNLQSAVSNVMWQLTFGRTFPLQHPFFKRIREVTHKLSLSIIHPFVILIDAIPFLEYVDFLFGNPLKKAGKCMEDAMDITKKELLRVESITGEEESAHCYAASFIKEIKRREANDISEGHFHRDQLLISATSHWIAGIETTVTTLRFGIHFLATNFTVQQNMQSEINAQIGHREIRMEDQKLLPYCMATIFEIQRLANVGELNFFRLANRETVIGGYLIPAGTTILPQFPSVLIDSNVFDKPNEFIPERFLNDNGEFVKDPRMTPFSIGIRSCPGEGLAKMELFLFLTVFVQHLVFSTLTSCPPNLKISYGLTKSLEPFKVKITARH